jgi:uncharacterized protein YggU (UPF0235/DUF167 family)
MPRDRLDWDPWRKRWIVSCRAPAVSGAANDAIATLVANWLGVSPDAVRWVIAGRSRAKVIEVAGLPDSEIAFRLERVRSKPSH